VGCLVPAAGLGLRLGAGRPKALVDLAGEPLLVHAVRALRACPLVGPVVVAAPVGDLPAVTDLLAPYDVVVVPGGASRQESVGLALSALPPGVDLVLVHDAARCLVPGSVVGAVIEALLAGADAVVPVVPLADTVKHVDGTRVLGTVDRSGLRAVQTPQGFRRDVLARAHAAGIVGATDDASLVEALGGPVVTVPGHAEAFKVTGPFDVVLAESVLARRAAPGGRHAR
jgi:2-C-methyl-D-erythritol 4-phosphate cytidylyltransferase